MGPLRSLGEALLITKREEIRPIGFEDFVMSLRKIRPSVSREGLEAFERWNDEFGSKG
jgi:fidgetin-like protein 1